VTAMSGDYSKMSSINSDYELHSQAILAAVDPSKEKIGLATNHNVLYTNESLKENQGRVL